MDRDHSLICCLLAMMSISILYASPVFADKDYWCSPVGIGGSCLGPSDDLVKVFNINISSSSNGEIKINASLTSVLQSSVFFYYILEITDEGGHTIYLKYKDFQIPGGAAAQAIDLVKLEPGAYIAKVLLWDDLQNAPFQPLLMHPAKKQFSVASI
jgi:hypothetical protein